MCSPKSNIKVITICPMCHGETELSVNGVGYEKWKNGTLIQEALPELDVDQREQLISGTCPACWNKLFSE